MTTPTGQPASGAAPVTDEMARVFATGADSCPCDSVALGTGQCCDRAGLAAVLVLLAAAGRLVPEGGETRQEWGSRPPGGGGVSIEDDEEDARKWCTRRPYRELVRRTVTFWPDGTQLVGPWEPVDTEGEHRG